MNRVYEEEKYIIPKKIIKGENVEENPSENLKKRKGNGKGNGKGKKKRKDEMDVTKKPKKKPKRGMVREDMYKLMCNEKVNLLSLRKSQKQKKESFECSDCNHIFNSRVMLRNHFIYIHQNLHCGCKKSFKSLKSYSQHTCKYKH